MYLRPTIFKYCLLSAVLSPVGHALAVVINGGNGSGDTSAPADDPGWNNVGVAGTGTAVYLGNRWVITAAHVGVQAVSFAGQTFTPEANTAFQLSNPSNSGVTGNADVLMYRLTSSPNLPSLAVATSTPAFGSSVTMIGAGLNRAAAEVSWSTHANSGGTVTWTQVSFGGNQQGYFTLDSRQMRYGTNSVASNGDSLNQSSNGNTFSLATVFTSNASFSGPAQASAGDSGGAVFTHALSGWQLAGIIDSQATLVGQPANTVVFGDQTLFADLSRYGSEISGLVNSRDPNLAWQNPTNSLDVNNDGVVAPLDALAIINELNKNGAHALPLPPLAGNAPPPYYDVAGNGSVAPIDALMIINYLNSRTSANTFLASVSGNSVAEPSTAALAALGVAGLLAWRWRKNRSRRY